MHEAPHDSGEDLEAAKRALRRRMRRELDALSPAEVAAASKEALRRLDGVEEFRQAAEVLAYVPIPGEVAIGPVLEQVIAECKRLWLPVHDRLGNLRWGTVRNLGDLRPGPWGLLVPPEETVRALPRAARMACLVPGLAWTPECHRLGRGGGHYDRFLAGFAGFAIGLAFDCQVLPELPRLPHDQSVQTLLTPGARYRRP